MVIAEVELAMVAAATRKAVEYFIIVRGGCETETGELTDNLRNQNSVFIDIQIQRWLADLAFGRLPADDGIMTLVSEG